MPESPAAARRDGAVIALIAFAHFNSHFFQLVLPPLFPLLKVHFDVSYTALGGVMSVFFAASGIAQAGAGFIVDRFGGRRVLIVGTIMLVGAWALAGLVPAFWMLYPLALIAGLGNSVYHPADFAILSHAVSKTRLGRAYSVHGLGGTLGYASAPIAVGALAELASWPAALAVCALLGVIVIVLVWRAKAVLGAAAEPVPKAAADAPATTVLALVSNPAIVAGFVYFLLAATVTTGMQNGGVPAVMAIFDVSLRTATALLTVFLVATAAGSLLGGIVADRTIHHDRMAIFGILTGASAMAAIAALPLPIEAAIAITTVGGAALGIASPARDLLIRAASPPGATGRVFGLVYSGLDSGASLVPLAAGWLLDRGEPRAVFGLFVIALAFNVLAVLRVRRVRVQATT